MESAFKGEFAFEGPLGKFNYSCPDLSGPLIFVNETDTEARTVRLCAFPTCSALRRGFFGPTEPKDVGVCYDIPGTTKGAYMICHGDYPKDEYWCTESSYQAGKPMDKTPFRWGVQCSYDLSKDGPVTFKCARWAENPIPSPQ